MTKKQVLSLLEANKDKRGMAHWRKSGNSQLKSFGLGLTKIKALGRRIGRNHKLALELWNTPIYEAKLLSTVVDKSKEVTPQQVDRQIKDADFWLLSHAYCSNLMPKTPFMKEKAEEWAAGKNALLRRCGYLLIYQLAKDNKILGDPYFQPYLDKIERFIQSEDNFVKDAMNNALYMIGQRSKRLNTQAIRVAKKIGRVEVDYGDNSCQAIDCVKHLISKRVQEKVKRQ